MALAVGAPDLVEAAAQAKLRLQIGGGQAGEGVLVQEVDAKTGQLTRGG